AILDLALCLAHHTIQSPAQRSVPSSIPYHQCTSHSECRDFVPGSTCSKNPLTGNSQQSVCVCKHELDYFDKPRRCMLDPCKDSTENYCYFIARKFVLNSLV